ncbi:hypothetical protein [Roseibium sp. SCP14]|uniref:hypothetical protein n=1 Tax=Roseibium sp. SCP14 TaxID=3141375 RepID=UPI003335E840
MVGADRMNDKVFILIRTDKKSDTSNWAEDDSLRRISDYRYSLYGDISNVRDIPSLHYFSGGKWTGIYDFFYDNPNYINKYEYFWFPDDDIETTPAVAGQFLDTVVEKNFKLAQPALKPDSYYADRMTIVNPSFSFRNTNFVELMMPIMHRDIVRRLLPLFKDRHAALGLDFFWHQLTDDPANEVAIVDATPMGHYRPRKQHLKSNMSKMQIDIMKERDATFRLFEIKRQMPAILAGETVDGRYLKRGAKLWWAYFSGLQEVRQEVCNPKWTFFHSLKFFSHQVLSNAVVPCYNRRVYEDLLLKSR